MALLLRNVQKINLIGTFRPYSEVVNVFGRRNVDTKPREENVDKKIATIPENAESVEVLSGYPPEIQATRKCRIFVQTKNAMQSGIYQTNKWKIEFDNQTRWENPLMGWGSNSDPVSNLTLEFGSKEDAIVYCQRMGFAFTVSDAPKIKKQFGKSYGANFSWNKNTRTSTK